MLPHPFRYHRPQTLEAVLELLSQYGDDAALYAGGTELLLALKARVLRYDHLIDLKAVASLRGVRADRDAIVIGAMSTHHGLATDPLIARALPALASLSGNVANIRVRVAGTLGGNLCFAEPHADPPALLAAMGATLTLRGPDGERMVAIADFIQGEFTTAREADEVLTKIRVPLPNQGERYAYRNFGHLERPAVGVAAGFVPSGGEPQYRLWAGAIAGAPIRLTSVERALAGVPPENVGDVLPPAAAAAAAELPAHDDLQGSADYKRHLAAVLISRAVKAAATPGSAEERTHGRAV